MQMQACACADALMLQVYDREGAGVRERSMTEIHQVPMDLGVLSVN